MDAKVTPSPSGLATAKLPSPSPAKQSLGASPTGEGEVEGGEGSSSPQSIDLSAHLTKLHNVLGQRQWVSSLRPVQSFIFPKNFSVPRNTAEASTRLEVNLSHFASNYVLMSLVLFAMVVLSRPFLLLISAVLLVGWVYALQTETIQVGNVKVSGRNKIIALSAASGLVVLLTAGSTLFLLVGMCVTLVLVHATFHSMSDDAELDAASLQELEVV